MESNKGRLITIIRSQAELFLKEMGEFFPFGTYINGKGIIVPVGAFTEEENPASIDLINMLSNYIHNKLIEGDCTIAAIAIDSIIRENGQAFDAIEVRLFENESENIEKVYLKYKIEEHGVSFI